MDVQDFLTDCSSVIKTLKTTKLDDYLIALVLLDIRAIALRHERLRIEQIYKAYPPKELTVAELYSYMKDNNYG
jgi:hypothetical protein